MRYILYWLLWQVCLIPSAFGVSPAKTGPEGLPAPFRLVPQPQKVILLTGKGLSATAINAIALRKKARKPILSRSLKNLPVTAKIGPHVLAVELSEGEDLPRSAEGYVLTAKNDGVVIRARTQAGLFYGCQTLAQLLDDARDQQIDIPACVITDYPDVAYRAIHLDLKHHLDSISYYYALIDRLAAVKINAVIVEFEDKLRYRKAPVVGASHAIPIEAFAALSRYASDRNIEISPLVQGLGHASYILKHEAYKHLRENPASDWVFSPLDPQTYDLQFALYEDAMAATPNSKYLHVGGDEVGELGGSDLSKKSGMNPLELQMHWLTKVCAFARQHNRTPIFWDDMVFKLAGLYQTTYDASVPKAEVEKAWQQNKQRLDENIGLFPKSCVYMRWNYDTPDIPGNHNAIDWYKSHQLNVMAATSAEQVWPMLPRAQSNFQAIKDFCKITSEEKLTGILCTIWDDTSPHFETVWRGIYDFAGLSWQYTNVSVSDAHASFRHRFYGPAVTDAAYEFEDLLEQALPFWETALLAKGDRNNAHATVDLIDIPDPDKPGQWKARYKDRLRQAHVEAERYAAISQRIASVARLARRNQYNLALMKALNELQVYPAKLLLLLEQYDTLPASAEKQTAERQLKTYVSHFQDLRQGFETVFSRTRLLQNPPDYQLDANVHHHLANATNTSDWMYSYELAMNAKLLNRLAH